MGEGNSQQTVTQLVGTLEEQIKVYRSLLEVVRKEKEILISANLDDLNENNKAKEAMLIKIRSLESERIKLANEAHKQLNVPGDQVRITEIARYVEPAVSAKLHSIHSVLELLLRRVQEFNKQNEVLVQSALTNVTGAMNAIKGHLQEKPTYQKKGEVEGHASSGQLVRREV